MGAGTRQAEGLAEQQSKGPFVVLSDLEVGEVVSARVVQTLEEAEVFVQHQKKVFGEHMCIRAVRVDKALAAPCMVDALKDALGDMRWAESADPKTNFQASIIKIERALTLAGEVV